MRFVKVEERQGLDRKASILIQGLGGGQGVKTPIRKSGNLGRKVLVWVMARGLLKSSSFPDKICI